MIDLCRHNTQRMIECKQNRTKIKHNQLNLHEIKPHSYWYYFRLSMTGFSPDECLMCLQLVILIFYVVTKYTPMIVILKQQTQV